MVFADSIDLAGRVRCNGHPLRQPEKLCGMVQIFPDRLTGAVPMLVEPMLEHIEAPGLTKQSVPKIFRKIDPAAFAGLHLLDREALLQELVGFQLQHIPDPQAGCKARFNRKPVFRRQRRQ